MAYLDNSSITVDAVLTKKGREALAKGGNAFKITKFALSDDEIDYSLWNPLHPSGSDYYGAVIESMPVMEALIDETQTMRYKLISIDDVLTTATSVNLPYVELTGYGGTLSNGGTVTIPINRNNGIFEFSPKTVYAINGQYRTSDLDLISNGYGYTFILNKSKNDIINESYGMFTDTTAQFTATDTNKVTSTTQQFSGDGDFTALTRVGSSLQIKVNSGQFLTRDVTFSLPITVIGNQTGATFNAVLTFDIPDSYAAELGL